MVSKYMNKNFKEKKTYLESMLCFEETLALCEAIWSASYSDLDLVHFYKLIIYMKEMQILLIHVRVHN